MKRLMFFALLLTIVFLLGASREIDTRIHFGTIKKDHCAEQRVKHEAKLAEWNKLMGLR